MVSSDTLDFIYDFGFYLSILVALVGLLGLRKYNRTKDYIIIVYLLLSVSCDYLSANVMKWFQVQTNHHILNLWSILEFICVLLFYFSIKEKKNLKRYHLLGLLGFTVLCIVIFTSYRSFFEFSNMLTIYSAVYFSFTSVTLYYLFLRDVTINLLSTSLFWQNTGFFLYFTGNILVFLMIDYLFANYDLYYKLGWMIHNLLTIVKTLCFLIAFYINFRNYTTTSGSK